MLQLTPSTNEKQSTKVTVTVNDETWDRFDHEGQAGGTSKRDSAYLQRIISALEVALAEAKGELSIIAS